MMVSSVEGSMFLYLDGRKGKSDTTLYIFGMVLSKPEIGRDFGGIERKPFDGMSRQISKIESK